MCSAKVSSFSAAADCPCSACHAVHQHPGLPDKNRPCSHAQHPSHPLTLTVLVVCAAAGPAVLSASQRCAADLMPAIGVGHARRVPRLGAKPSDAELKETISALQRTASRVPGSSGACSGGSNQVLHPASDCH